MENINRRMQKRQCLLKCTYSDEEYKRISFFSFPKDVQLRQLWCEAIKINQLHSGALLCDRHFDPSHIDKQSGCRPYLRKRALPIDCPAIISNNGSDLIDMDLKSDSQFSLEHTCRTCLKNVHEELMIAVFDPICSDSSSVHILEELNIMNLKISQDDGLPQQICSECMGRLSDVASFRRHCERAQSILEDYFKSTTVDVIRSEFMDPDEKDQWSNETKAVEPCKMEERSSDSAYSGFEFLNIESVQFDGKNTIQEKAIAQNSEGDTVNLMKYHDGNELDNENQPEEMFLHNNDESNEGSDSEEYDYTESKDEDFDEDAENEDKFDIGNGCLECNICKKVYKREVHLKRHQTKHHANEMEFDSSANSQPNETNFTCNKCEEKFPKLKYLEVHLMKGECSANDDLQCRFCFEQFESVDQLDNHVNDKHPPQRPHMCPICKKTFQSVSNRNTHLQSHNKEDSYKCDICGQGFKSKVYLKKHKKSVHTMADHECPHCFQKFDNTTKYEYHLKSHDPNKKYKCKFCDKSFLQQHHLANHERTHTGIRPYLCNICGKDFKQECNFKLHLRIHSGVRPYICSVCGKDFIQRGSFVMHMRQHSGVRPYQCEHCGKDFVQKSSLTVHLRTHTGERPYKCDSCDKAFAQAQQMKYHRHSAHGGPAVTRKDTPPKLSSDGRVYPYCCPMCNKGFKLPSSLSSHLKIHNEQRKHVCNQCGNSFKRAEHLRIHVNGVHLKQKPYKCEMCSKTFAQSGDRNIHMLRHTGEKPHQCTYCKKNFRLMKAMRAHMRIHTGEKPYACEFCKMEFMTYTSLATHIMKHENDNRKAIEIVDTVEPSPAVPNMIDDEAKPLTISSISENSSIITLTVPSVALSSIIVTVPPP